MAPSLSSSLEIVAENEGVIIKSSVVTSPDGDLVIRWAGKRRSAGQYRFTAVGKIGDLQTFTSNEVVATLAN